MKIATKRRQDMYDRSGNRYEEARYGNRYDILYRQLRNETLAAIIKERFGEENPLRILEIGCGTGLTLAYLAALPTYYELHGLDFSLTMLSQSHQKSHELDNPFQLAQGDTFQLPFRGESFDVVYSTRFIHQFEHDEKKKIYREIMRVLRPGGLAITEFYTRHNKWTLYLRGLRNYPSARQCPSISEVRDIIGGPFSRQAVRMVGLRLVSDIFGERALRLLTPLTINPPLNVLLEEYFVTSTK